MSVVLGRAEVDARVEWAEPLFKGRVREATTRGVNLSDARTAAYRQQSVPTAPPGRLMVLPYDGCVRVLDQAAAAMRDGDVRAADGPLRRAEAILDELPGTLDLERGGEIASRLQGVYVFCRGQLLDARSERGAGRVEEIRELLERLRAAWAEIAAA